MKTTSLFFIFVFSVSLGLVQAQVEKGAEEDITLPPPIPPKVTDEQVEPSVEIRKEEDRLIEEYSLNGRVYMVKVTPQKGVPYYYIDEDGDGVLELQQGDEHMNPVRPVYWKVKEWK